MANQPSSDYWLSIDALITNLIAVSNWLWTSVLSSAFSANLLTAAAGAFAGACGGAYIVNRRERRKLQIAEIRATNAAIMMAWGAFETYFALKAQFLNDIRMKYNEDRAHTHRLVEQYGSLSQAKTGPIMWNFDLRSLNPVEAPVDLINEFIINKVSLSGRTIHFAFALARSTDALNRLLVTRNEFIENFRTMGIPDIRKAEIIFGLTDNQGHTDETYGDLVEGMFQSCDDCIAYSKMLLDDLESRGTALAKTYGRSAPKIHKIKLADAEATGLMPNFEEFADWLRMPQ